MTVARVCTASSISDDELWPLSSNLLRFGRELSDCLVGDCFLNILGGPTDCHSHNSSSSHK
jgi:hypothetical protein